MFIKKIVCTLAAALCVQQAAAVSFNAGTATMEGEWGTGITGQAFSPQENASPNVFDGVSPTDIFPAYLQELNFTRGGNAGGGAAVTSVDIYQPTGATLATSTLIGSSLNTVDTTAEVENEVYTFQFNNLELFHSTTYLAVFKDDGGNVVGLNIEQNFEGNAGVGDYVSGGAIFDFDASGWSGDTNADFSTVFSDMAPTAVASFNSASTSNGGEWSAGLQGQAFVPRTKATPNPAGIGGQPEEVFLTGMIFTQGGNVGGGDATSTLDIYRPTGATIATSEFIGSLQLEANRIQSIKLSREKHYFTAIVILLNLSSAAYATGNNQYFPYGVLGATLIAFARTPPSKFLFIPKNKLFFFA